MGKHRGVSATSSPVYRYVLVYEDGLWSANYPDLHCWGVGKTRAAAVADLKEAARLMVDYLKEIGQRLPQPHRIEVGEGAF